MCDRDIFWRKSITGDLDVDQTASGLRPDQTHGFRKTAGRGHIGAGRNDGPADQSLCDIGFRFFQ